MESRGEKRYKSSYALLLPFRCIVFLLIFIVGAFAAGRQVKELSSIWSPAASAVNIVTIALLVAAAKRSGMSCGELIGFTKGGRSVKKTILAVILFAFVGMGGMYLSGLVCYGSVMPRVTLDIVAPVPLALAVINLVVLPLTVAFAEDGLYLGLGVNSIKNKYACIVVPAFFYALQHCFIPTIFDVRYMVYRFLSFLPLTVLFCVHYRKKKDPVPIMAAHTLLDLATAMTILITSSSQDIYQKMCHML